MSFTTFPFFVFLAVVLPVYYLLRGRLRRFWLLAASYVFYCWAAPALGLVVLVSTGVSYALGWAIGAGGSRTRGRLLLALGCVLHLGLLVVLKLLPLVLPVLAPRSELRLVMPVGISFFSFAIVGYLVDVYRGSWPDSGRPGMAPERDLVDYALFVVFFPCILAGPIGHARSFLPQLKQPRPFRAEEVKGGLLRFALGMVEKLVLADSLALTVGRIYSAMNASPATWLVTLGLYSLQIYFDFAGYSHMAIGVAGALGFTVRENFTAPYYSTSVTSFWRKWHISLTSWFREYLYIPLGGSRKGQLRTWCNILVVFAVSGLWHGVAWHYLAWGLVNGLLQVAERILQPGRRRLEAALRAPASRLAWNALAGVVTFALMSMTWLFFRAESMTQVRQILGQLAGVIHTGFGRVDPGLPADGPARIWVLSLVTALCAVLDLPGVWRWFSTRLPKRVLPCYGVLAALLLIAAVFGVYGAGFQAQDFVYFRY